MAPQTSYSIDIPAVSFPGKFVDISDVKDVLSAAAVLAAMPYGTLAVRDGSNSGGFDSLACKVPAAAADITTVGSALGCVLADQARAQDPSVGVAQYPQFSAIPCARKGRVWVKPEVDVVPHDGGGVFVRFLSGTHGTQLGQFRADVDTVTAVDHAAQLPSAVFRGEMIGDYIVVEFDLV